MNIFRAAARFGARQTWMARHQRSFTSPAPARKPRLFVDVSVILRHDAQTGIQRTVRAIWSELRGRDGAAFEIVPIAASRTHGYRLAPMDFLSRSKRHCKLGDVVRMGAGDCFLGLDLSAHLLPLYEAQLASWRAAGASVHMVVYDLLPLQTPEFFNPSTVANYRAWFDVLRRECDEALCISDQVAAELRQELGSHQACRIGRVRLAGDIAASIPTKGIDPKSASVIEHLKTRPAVLMVGTVEPRKAYDIGLAAFEHLWSNGPQDAPALVIVGKPGWRTDQLQQRLRDHPEQGRRLFWLSSASDEALSILYRESVGLLLTSHAEGFGLPVAEAAAHGRRALVRDLPVFREQALPGTRYFLDDSPAQLAETVLTFVRGSEEVTSSASLATWSTCVDELLNALLRSVGQQHGQPCAGHRSVLVA